MRNPTPLTPRPAWAHPSKNNDWRKQAGGFTLIELVVTILLVSILSAVMIPRFMTTKELDARTFSDQMQAMLRYAQKTAIAKRTKVWFRLNANSIALCLDKGCTAGNLVTAPSGKNSGSSATLTACSNNRTWLCEGWPSGFTVAAAPAPAASGFFFDSLGKPFDNLSNEIVGKTTITLTAGSLKYFIYVEPETGYVHP